MPKDWSKNNKNQTSYSTALEECLIFRILGTLNIPKSNVPSVVIVSGGFVGISLVKKLSRKEVQVVLILLDLFFLDGIFASPPPNAPCPYAYTLPW